MRWRDFDDLPALPVSLLATSRHLHFVGIGGIGMSALAFFLLDNGHRVSGSDMNESPVLQKLREAGAVIAIGHAEKNLDTSDVPDGLVYTSAVDARNAELAAAGERGITAWHRGQLLAAIANRAKCSIAVSGTHGKSTTSAMIAHVLHQCGKNPTALLGANFPPFGSNARLGDADLVVVEADESDGSFTLLHPTLSVVTNVEAEHLENYDDSEEELWRAFEVFARSSGLAVLNKDQPEMCERLRMQANGALPYSLLGHDDIHAGVPGEHNRSNAAAALEVALHLGINRAEALAALASFYGVSRRFEKVGEVDDVLVYDDYAHHPTEVKSTLEAASDALRRPIIAIFQPHRYSRTQHLGAQFGESFKAAQTVIITELYSAFEEPIPGVSGRIVFDAVRRQWPRKKVLFAKDLKVAQQMAVQMARPGDAIFTLGAGNINQLASCIVEDLRHGKSDALSKVLLDVADFEPMFAHTTMRVGGAARWWLEPESEAELEQMLKLVHAQKIPLRVIGAGSNLIVADDGFDGAVLKLGKAFAKHHLDGDQLIAGGLAMLPKLTHFALNNQRGGAEWMCGIPGSVGGSLRGNAGSTGYDGNDFKSYDCASFLNKLTVFDRSGQRFELGNQDVEFAYRSSSLKDFIVTNAVFDLYAMDEKRTAAHREAVKELLKQRRESQPVNAACSGCIWKNPTVQGCAGAGALVERAGCKGMKVGDAMISLIHGNFVVNTGVASSDDIQKLIEKVEAKVLLSCGVQLQREVQWWGSE